MKQKIKSIYKRILKKIRIATTYNIQEQNSEVKTQKEILQEQINEMRVSVNKLEKVEVDVQSMKSDMQSVKNDVQSMKSDIDTMKLDIQSIKSDIQFIKNDNYRVERDLYKCYKNLEYKVYEFNKSGNTLLYEDELKLNAMQNNVRENFNPKVSIIIPAYNASKYITQAIDSALTQTYKNIEIIVVNDGSNDNGATEKICLSYGDKIKYYKKENGGVSSALNLGISKMTGDYFAWLSYDDLYYPTNIYEHIRCLKNNKNENIITFSNCNVIDENSNIILSATVDHNLFCFDYKVNQTKPEYSLLQGEINGGSVLIPKEAFKKCGLFNEKLRIAQERDMWFRLIQKGYTFFNIPLETTAIRLHSQQVTNTNNETMKETNEKRLEIVENLSPDIKKKLEHSEYNFYTIMKNFYWINNIKELEAEMDKHLERLKQANEDNDENN